MQRTRITVELETGHADALREAARKLGYRHHVGIAQSKDSFYGEVERNRMPMSERLEQRWKAWVAGGAGGEVTRASPGGGGLGRTAVRAPQRKPL